MPCYTKKIDLSLFVHYKDLLKNENCTFTIPQYTCFCARNKDWQITFYKSGKVLVQGKNIDYIVQKYFDKNFKSGYICPVSGELAPYPHIGTDESGKGDFFGPLVVAGCYLTEDGAKKMKKSGAVDSKKLNDEKIAELAVIIKENSEFKVMVFENKEYNDLYEELNNLNKLLALGHASVLEELSDKTGVKTGVSDKFGEERFILNALHIKNFKLTQQTGAECDTAVACASILARNAFVEKMSELSAKYGFIFPKGAGEKVRDAGKKFLDRFGAGELYNVSKMHFKTGQDICASQTGFFNY